MSGVDWVQDFYSRTGRWWGAAEAVVTDDDRDRAAHVTRFGAALRVLELGSGYGGAAVATALAGHTVTAIELTDRARHTPRLSAEHHVPGHALTLIRGDFHTARPGHRFDLVTYWDGFGVGTDDDQRRLLTRIARDWLAPGGAALIEVYNPFDWAAVHGHREHRDARPADGYPCDLDRQFTFDQHACTAIDTWWETAHPEQRVSQRLRCYTPADLALLLTGTGLRLDAVHPPADPDAFNYLAVLR